MNRGSRKEIQTHKPNSFLIPILGYLWKQPIWSKLFKWWEILLKYRFSRLGFLDFNSSKLGACWFLVDCFFYAEFRWGLYSHTQRRRTSVPQRERETYENIWEIHKPASHTNFAHVIYNLAFWGGLICVFWRCWVYKSSRSNWTENLGHRMHLSFRIN